MKLDCPVIVLDGTLPVEQNIDVIKCKLSDDIACKNSAFDVVFFSR